jgi:hypothetical protein
MAKRRLALRGPLPEHVIGIHSFTLTIQALPYPTSTDHDIVMDGADFSVTPGPRD